MKPKKNQLKHRSQKRNRGFDPVRDKVRFCDPGACTNCHYIGDGDFICDRNSSDVVIVVSDWEPTDDYMICWDRSSFRPKERQQKPTGRRSHGRPTRGKRHG